MKFKIQYSTGGSLEPKPLVLILDPKTGKYIDNSKMHSKDGYKFTNETLKEAVQEWKSKETNEDSWHDDKIGEVIKKYGHISTWDVSEVTNMNGIFAGSSFNQPLDSWDVSKVTDMSLMFYNATAFNQDISQWDVSSVTNMFAMFEDAKSFNQPLYSWDVSRVKNMGSMFKGATAFNQDIGQWPISENTKIKSIFSNSGVTRDTFINGNGYGDKISKQFNPQLPEPKTNDELAKIRMKIIMKDRNWQRRKNFIMSVDKRRLGTPTELGSNISNLSDDLFEKVTKYVG